MTNREILDSIRGRISSPPELASLLASTVALLRREWPHYDWVGVYLLKGEELVLGPYLGKPTVHTRIRLNEGICGAAASSGQTLIVDDVSADPRYLACSLETRSEIVVPISTKAAFWAKSTSTATNPRRLLPTTGNCWRLSRLSWRKGFPKGRFPNFLFPPRLLRFRTATRAVLRARE